MAVITLSEVKVFLQIGDTSKDALITALIPQVEEAIKEYCNVAFVDPWPVGLKLPAALMIGHDMAAMSGGGTSIGLQSESQGDYSYSRGTGTNGANQGSYPDVVLKRLDPYKVSRVHFSTVQTQPRD